MDNKKRGRPRKRETIYIQCPDCNKFVIKSKEEYKIKGAVQWNTSQKSDDNNKTKKSFIINIIED
jgi:sarcosine oxidase delta subunit